MTPRLPLFRNLLAVLALALPTAVFSASGPEATPGVPWTGAAGVHRTVRELSEGQPLRTSESRAAEMAEREKIRPDRSKLPQAPGSPALSQWPPAEEGTELTGGGLVNSITAPQSPGTSFIGATLFGSHPTFSFPPDGMGAVGPSQFVVFVNGRIVSYDKLTGLADGVLDLDPNPFFSPVSGGISTSDPRIRYDRLTGRWFLVIISVSTPNRVLIAMTDAASNGVIAPSTVFSFFFFPIDTPPPSIPVNCFADYPTLGIDTNALYIGANIFCGAPLSFQQADGFVVRKSSLTGGGPLVVTALRGLVPSSANFGPYTPQGVDNYDPAATEGYFIGVDNLAFGRLVLRRVSTPAGTPTVSGNINITVPMTRSPQLVAHLGNSGGTAGQLSGLDDRLFAAHIRNGRLWTAHSFSVNNVGVVSQLGGQTGTRNASRWYELQNIVSPGVPGVRQSGTVYFASGSNTTDQPQYWIPSIMVSGQGHAAMGFSQAGTSLFADGAFTGRLADDALGAMAMPVIQFSTAFGSYNPGGDPGDPFIGRRWGDYSYTSLDPIDDMTMWTIQQFTDQFNSYGLQVIKLVAPPPATPASVPDVDAGLPSVVVTVTGNSISGSGFFDPGSNLGGGVPAFSHLGATVTNTGVTGNPPTVNSVTYVDPTHVQLDLNTTLANINQPGQKYTVRITNPDGQIAQAAVLRVAGPVGVEGGPETPIALGAVWPNPSAGLTRIEFGLPRAAHVRVSIVDLAGREIAILANGTETAGTHHLTWNGRRGNGPAPAGMYYVRYETAGEVHVRRFAMLR